MNPEAALGALCAALRGAGLPVGVSEALRLRLVLGRGGGEDLREVVAAVVLKGREQRPAFDAAFAAWAGALRPAPETRVGPGPAPVPRQRRWYRLAGMVALLASAVLLRPVLRRPVAKGPAVDRPRDGEAGGPGAAAGPKRALVPYRVPVPGGPILGRSWLGAELSGLALLFGVALYLFLRRRSYLPAPAGAPPGGLSRVLLPSPPGAAPRLLDRRQEEALVYGIGRFVAGESTRRLDLPATVAATAAAGGRSELRFAHLRHDREVWLWTDDSTGSLGGDDGAQRRLGGEIGEALARAGLPVERARFYGVPERLLPEDGGAAFAPGEVEDRREAALVAVLTDGRLLEQALADAGQRRRTEALLRQLGNWPGLCFVDFGGRLAALLRPRGIPVVAPADLAATLAGLAPGRRGRGSGARPGGPLRGDERAWAAACALSPQPLDEGTALALGRALGLRVTPWQLGRLPWAAGRVAFPPGERAALLGWLRAAPAELSRAVAFLLARYQKDESSARLRLERGILRLWTEPGATARELYRLWGGAPNEVREAVRHELSGLAALEWAGEGGLIILPWRYRAQQVETRVMLREMGFAGRGRWRSAPESLRRPGRVYLGLAACAGLALSGLSAPPVLRQVGVKDAGMAESETCPYKEEVDGGLAFVRVCAGGFWMGSEGDPQAYKHETPAYPVQVGREYWIGKYEVSNKEYRRVVSDHDRGEPDDLPVRNVTWEQARVFCQKLEHRLPTEVEWEYAARGRESRIYPWGDEAPGERRAVFGRDVFKDKPDPVTSLEEGRGPFGALHQAGNVWEWVEDCYGDSAAIGSSLDTESATYRRRRRQSDKDGPLPIGGLTDGKKGCEYRVVRGGSFAFGPRDLRSANRYRDRPVDGNRNLGFRCVRGSGRQFDRR